MTYQVGETMRITATITDTDGDTADPVTTVISIKKPDGTLGVDAAAMTKSETGIYYYDYLIASDIGTYRVSIKATGSAGRITIEPVHFRAEAAI